MAIKTTKKEIVNANKSYLEEGYASIAETQAQTHCWRCGIKKRLDRCHITPESRGGQDIASNFVLLCKHCHIASPDLGDLKFMWTWIRAYKVTTDFYLEQGIREFEFIYQTKIHHMIETKNITYEDFIILVLEEMKQIPNHFGQPRHNASSVAGLIAQIMNM